MSKHLFIINDDGNEYEITGTRIEMEDSFVVDPLLYLETPIEDFFYYVKELIDGDNRVKYPKDISFSNAILNLTNGGIVITSKLIGINGDSISILLTDPGDVDQVLDVTVNANAISVSLGTDSTAFITTTINQVADAINNDVEATALVTATIESGVDLLASPITEVFLTGGGDEVLNDTDLLITPMNSLDLYKARTRTRGKHTLKQYCDFTLLFDFFQFHILNNKLIDAGYVITDENREAKYLEVINTGNTILISILEEYLEVKDRIEINNHHYENFQTFKLNVNDAIDTAEIDIAYNNYAALFG
jgi:hypothetical protein